MKRYALLLVGCSVFALGCSSDLPTTTDPDAIKREQERLGGSGPKGAPKGAKDDAIKREQDRLRGKTGP